MKCLSMEILLLTFDINLQNLLVATILFVVLYSCKFGGISIQG